MLNYRKQTAPFASVWQDIGLEFVYVEDSQRLEDLKKPKSLSSPSKTSFIKPNTYISKPQTAKIEESTIAKKPENLQSSPRSSEEAKENTIKSNNLPIPILKDYEWPQEWLDLWEKISKNTSPKIAWTYTGLHDDILGTENKVPQRQEIIRDFIRGLNSPNGTHAFVPFDMPLNAGKLMAKEDNSFYWSAISRLKVKQLFVFGEQARDALLIPQRPIGTTITHKGHRIYILKDLNKLIGDVSGVKSLLEYLNIQLSSVKI